MEKVRYRHLNTYLKEKFGERTLKICVDGGFTCPNRDGRKDTKGCIFCSSMGSGDLIKFRQDNILDSIKSQVNGFLSSYRGERANKFIVYFQSFTNTYDRIENLKEKYDTALNCSEKIVGLEIATRPDCVTKEIIELLSSYQNKYYVCVELGLQTSNNVIGKMINRQYTTEEFVNAVELLHKYNIDVVAHLMVGLPNETQQDIVDTVKLINDCNCEGIKIHSTYVVNNCKLNDMFKSGEYEPITMKYYIEKLCYIISHLNKDIVIHRINADPPKNIFVAPDWMLKKKIVINSINKQFNELNISQGDKLINITN